MKSILSILLIFNGICFGAVKKRYRTMARAKHSMQHVVKRKMCPFAQLKEDKNINNDSIFKRKFIKLSYKGLSNSVNGGNSISTGTSNASLVQKKQPSTTAKSSSELVRGANQWPRSNSNANNISKTNSFSGTGVPTIVSKNVRLASLVANEKSLTVSVAAGSIKGLLRSSDVSRDLPDNLMSNVLITDLSNNNSYYLTTDVTPGLDNEFNAIYNFPDGGLICVGYCNGSDSPPTTYSSLISLVKYTNAGVPDSTFGTDGNGIVITDLSLYDANVLSSVANSVTVDFAGNIYVVGYVYYNTGSSTAQEAIILKYDKNGTLVNVVEYQLEGVDSSLLTGITIEFLSQPGEQGEFFDLVFSGTLVFSGIEEGLVGKVDPINFDPVNSFNKGRGFIRIIVNPEQSGPTVLNSVAIGSIQVPPSVDITNYIYVAGSASYLGTSYMLIVQLDTNGEYVNTFDQNGVILLDISNIGKESVATAVTISRGGPVIGGYWTDDNGVNKASVAQFTYLGVLYNYNNSSDTSKNTQTTSIVGAPNGKVFGCGSLVNTRARGSDGSSAPINSQTQNIFLNPYASANSGAVYTILLTILALLGPTMERTAAHCVQNSRCYYICTQCIRNKLSYFAEMYMVYCGSLYNTPC